MGHRTNWKVMNLRKALLPRGGVRDRYEGEKRMCGKRVILTRYTPARNGQITKITNTKVGKNDPST